jgi:hypothetical protein
MPITQHLLSLQRSPEGLPILWKENQRTLHPKQLDGQAPTRAIEHDTFHNDAHSIKELLWNAFHICPVAIAITYGKSIENKDRFQIGGRSMKGQTSNPKVPAKFDSLLIWCSVTAFLEQVAGVLPVAFPDSAVVWYAHSTFYLSQPCNGHKGLHPARVCLRWKRADQPTERSFIEMPLRAKPSASTNAGLQFGGSERVQEVTKR